MLYTHSIGNQPYDTMVVFKKSDSVPSVRYSSVCNVLRLWNISLIPTYRVYLHYDTRKRYSVGRANASSTYIGDSTYICGST